MSCGEAGARSNPLLDKKGARMTDATSTARLAYYIRTLTRRAMAGGMTLREARKLYDSTVICIALEQSRGNQCRAAALLGIHRNTLRRLLDNLNLALPELPATKKAKALRFTGPEPPLFASPWSGRAPSRSRKGRAA
jgi:Bacterial regulatory protein, Fis family